MKRTNKTNDMNNKLLLSVYIKTAKTYSTNITLDVKPDINTCSLNQLKDDKHIYKPIPDSQEQINTNRLININQTSERLKQTTVKKSLAQR